MYAFVASRRRHGDALPRRLASGRCTSRMVARAISSRFTGAVVIDALEGVPKSYPPGCRQIGEVKEIVLVDHLACVLLKSGLARCFDSTDGRLVCELNPVNPSAVHFAAVHTIVFNAVNSTLIVAYSAMPAHLQCKVIPIEGLKEGHIDSAEVGRKFESVMLRHPAFFEFCGTNRRIGAADLYKHVYRFWDMGTYELVFEVRAQGYQEIRVSDGVVVMLSQPEDGLVPISLYDIEDGRLLASRSLEIVPHRELQFLELLVTQLLIKQRNGPMRVYDILRDEGFIVNDTMHFRPSGFVFHDTSATADACEAGRTITSKFTYRPRRFFTISRTCIEFWELTQHHLIQLRRLQIHGMDNPDLCCHSLWANLLFVRAQQFQPFSHEVAELLGGGWATRDHIRLPRPAVRPSVSRVHTPTKDGQPPTEVDIFAADDDWARHHSVHIFSLDGSTYYGRIDRKLCGPRLRTLALANDLSVIGCGNDSGIVRLLRPGTRGIQPQRECPPGTAPVVID